MFQTINIFVRGLPAGQPRVKAANRGGFTSVYTPKRVKNSKTGKYHTHPAEVWKQAIVAEWRKSAPAMPLIEVPVELTLHLYFPRPKSHFNAKGLRGNAPALHATKPDADNAAKLVCDAITELGAWKDDSLVTTLLVTKKYSNTDATGCEIILKDEAV